MKNIMKYLHKPKLVNLCIYCLIVVIVAVSDAIFLLSDNSLIGNNPMLLLILHILLLPCYILLFTYTLSFAILSVEKCRDLFSIHKKTVFDRMLVIVNTVICILLGVVLFNYMEFFASLDQEGLPPKVINIFAKSILFTTLVSPGLSYEDIYVVYEWWMILPFGILTAAFVLFLRAALRERKLSKKSGMDAALGYEYEKSAFFIQTQIPYKCLSQYDGTLGEYEAFHALVTSDLSDAHYIFNREIPKADGLFTEIDIVVIHPNGIIVLENKHYTTRIYGNATDYELTIIDHYGDKKTIYNPIRQNEKHVVALKEFLKQKGLYINDDLTPIHSVVVFTAENYDRTDDIISGINTAGTNTKVCTSQNLACVIKRLLSEPSTAKVEVVTVVDTLSGLSVRRKS